MRLKRPRYYKTLIQSLKWLNLSFYHLDIKLYVWSGRRAKFNYVML